MPSCSRTRGGISARRTRPRHRSARSSRENCSARSLVGTPSQGSTAAPRPRRSARPRSAPPPGSVRAERTPPGAAQAVKGQVHRHTAHPLLGHVEVAHLRPAGRRSGEGLLDRVLRIAEVTGDQIHLADEPTEGALVELIETVRGRHAYLTFDRLPRLPNSTKG